MPNYILTQSATIICPHGGIVNHIPTSGGMYRINGELPMLMRDQFVVSGCPFMMPMGPSVIPSPCIRIQWLNGSPFLLVRGVPALTTASTGLCQSATGVPAGPPVISSFQTMEQEPTTLTRVN